MLCFWWVCVGLLVCDFWFFCKFVQYTVTFTEYTIERYQHNLKKQLIQMFTRTLVTVE